MSRKEKIQAFWERNNDNRIELYTKFLGYVPIDSITHEDEVFIYDCWRHSIPEKFENPMLEKIDTNAIAFGNFLRDNYHGVGAPKLQSYYPDKFPVGQLKKYTKLLNRKTNNHGR